MMMFIIGFVSGIVTALLLGWLCAYAFDQMNG